MAFINRVCDKVFVINMEKDKERLKDFDRYMAQNNITYERFPAVVGAKITNDTRLTDYCNTFCSDGVKGCALSHRTIWDIMVENNYKNVLVFEDDAVVDEKFDTTFQHVWNHLPKDFDVVYFGCIFGCTDDSSVNQVYKKIIGGPTEEINEFVHSTKGTAGTHCYMISLEGAKKFVNKKINFHIDTQMMWWIKEYNYNAYTSYTNLVETSQDNSSLSDTYPVLLNSILHNFTINNLKKPSTLDWSINEPLIKIGRYNLSALILILMLIVCFIPSKYYVIIFAWLLVELVASKDLKNTFRYIAFLSIPMGIKFFLTNK
uniref:Glycosyl transferase family 25 domain-containing protein n=1 Tax=viral metagenome TaxID=1070528 RepID=A0A6C0D7M5_9ZZZZ